MQCIFHFRFATEVFQMGIFRRIGDADVNDALHTGFFGRLKHRDNVIQSPGKSKLFVIKPDPVGIVEDEWFRATTLYPLANNLLAIYFPENPNAPVTAWIGCPDIFLLICAEVHYLHELPGIQDQLTRNKKLILFRKLHLCGSGGAY